VCQAQSFFGTVFDFEAVKEDCELAENEFWHSINRPGHCTDNAFMESFFHSLKAEPIRGTIYRKATELRRALSTYINVYQSAL